MNEERVQILKEAGYANSAGTSPRAAAIQFNQQPLRITYQNDEDNAYYADEEYNNDAESSSSKSINMMDKLYYEKSSIDRFLPGIDLGEVARRAPRVNSSLEMITAPIMREKYQREMEKKLAMPTDNVVFNLVDQDTEAKNSHTGRKVRLEFLNNVSYLKYMKSNQGKKQLSGLDGGKKESGVTHLTETERMDEAKSVVSDVEGGGENVEDDLDEQEYAVDEDTGDYENVKQEGALILYDLKTKLTKMERNQTTLCTPKSSPNLFGSGANSARAADSLMEFPPLSMNALMEYKPVLVAPGKGDFDQGRPRVFKLNH
jgi:hypothetical protein